MRTRTVWTLAVATVVLGVALLYATARLVEPSPWLTLGMTLLVVVPIPLAVNLSAGRSRRARGEDSPDSVEHHAAHAARSGAFGDVLILAALLILALASIPGTQPAFWAVTFLVATVLCFWVRYGLELSKLRG